MTEVGIVHLLSAIYLAGVISLAVSVNENRAPGRLLRETLRRWLKFIGLGVVLGLVITAIIKLFS